jgi:hypothetical protein
MNAAALGGGTGPIEGRPPGPLWAHQAIAKKLFEKYRGVRMPNLGLDQDEIAALLLHIERESQAAARTAGPSPSHAHASSP